MTISLSDKYLPEMMTYAKQAQSAYLWMDNAAIDQILSSVLDNLPSLCVDFARISTEETRMGIYEDKLTLLNRTIEDIRYQYLPYCTEKIRQISRIDTHIQQQPAGIILGITSLIHPAAAVISDCITAIRTKNPIILSFHPAAFSSSYAAASAIRDLAVSAGAPDNCIQWMEENTLDSLDKLIRHTDIASLMASGLPEHIDQYQSIWHGPAAIMKPSNAFCYIHRSADIRKAIHHIILSRTFDNGLFNCSEQVLLIDQPVYHTIRQHLKNEGCYMASDEEITRLTAVLIDLSLNTVNPAVIGQSPQTIAALADITLPEDTRLIGMEIDIDRPDHPLMIPYLCPVMIIMPVEQNEQVIDKINQLSAPDIDKPTLVIHSENHDVSHELSLALPACTILENTPAAGQPLTSLYVNQYGCHLDTHSLIQTLSLSRYKHQLPDTPHTFHLPATLHFQKGALRGLAFKDHQSRIVFLSDDVSPSYSDVPFIGKQIQQMYPSLRYACIHVPKDTQTGRSSDYLLPQLTENAPDCLIAIGDAQLMDTAKMLYTDYKTLYPSQSIELIMIPSISGCHTALLPFYTDYDPRANLLNIKTTAIENCTIIADSHLHIFSDYNAPTASIPENENICPDCLAAMADAFDTYLSNRSDDMTDALALQAICLFFEWLPALCTAENISSACLEHLQNACLLSGMAAAHTGIGLSRIMAGRPYCEFRIPLPTLQAILLPHILQYNGALHPTKYAWSSDASGAHITEKLQRILKTTASCSSSVQTIGHSEPPEAIADMLTEYIQKLLRESGMPMTIKACGIREKDYMLRAESMARKTFEQLSTGYADTNPRYPLIKELIQLYKQIYD